MVSLISADRTRFGETASVIENYRGKSGDDKPLLTQDRNGSVFYEMDTQNVYMWDGDTLTWVSQ